MPSFFNVFVAMGLTPSEAYDLVYDIFYLLGFGIGFKCCDLAFSIGFSR